tara:strand:- start:71 stop:331 length:261 start_codon:yes stop_codon:yes gene_type:complete
MITPAIMLICFLYVVRNEITFFPPAPEIIASTKSGILIPIPKTMKLSKLVRKLLTDVLTANNIAREAGLHGNTIAPKNNPNINELQ